MKSTNNFQTSNPEMVTISRAEYEQFQAQSGRIAEQEQQVSVLMEALRLARHKRFGASSEKTDESVMEQLSFLFNEAEVFSTAEKEDAEATDVAGHKRHKKHCSGRSRDTQEEPHSTPGSISGLFLRGIRQMER